LAQIGRPVKHLHGYRCLGAVLINNDKAKDEVMNRVMKKQGSTGGLNPYKGTAADDKYITYNIEAFFVSTGRFDPETEEKIAEALETIIDRVYLDGFEDAHTPVDNHCVVCGSYMPDEDNR
jgi:hypothetical protein